LTNIFRRVYRIFAHAWFQHREMYWHVELKSGLYVFFKTVCDVYNLIPEDNYTVPPEAEGLEPVSEPAAKPPSIMKRAQDEPEPLLKAPTADAATTKRHRHTPSVGSESITTVLEDPEEEDGEGPRLEETVILSSEPPEYSEQHSELEVGEEPGPMIENLAPAEDVAAGEDAVTTVKAVEKEEDTEATSVEVPLISTTEPEPETDPASTQAEPPTTETTKAEVESEAESESVLRDEPDSKADPEVEAEASAKAASSTASDTDSQDSWQVLTNDPLTSGSSAEVTPATSTTEEVETSEDDVETDTAVPKQAETEDEDEKDEEKSTEDVKKASKDEEELSKAEETKEASTESASSEATEESESQPIEVKDDEDDEDLAKSEKADKVEEDAVETKVQAKAPVDDDETTKVVDEADEKAAKTKEKEKEKDDAKD
jgi:hypothetical protein